MASAVTVGNESLAAWARQFNREVSVVSTSIDLAAYPRSRRSSGTTRPEPFGRGGVRRGRPGERVRTRR